MLDRFCNRPINGVALLACCWLAAPSGVFAGASDEVLAKVRGSDQYQRARQSTEDFVKTVDEHNAKQLCSNGLAPHR
jgi:hypothetical protein